MDPKSGFFEQVPRTTCIEREGQKIDQGILVIRFEMPFNIWCGGCNSMIAKGVRFNAEKKQVGNYYSTKKKGKLADPFHRLEHQGEDLKKEEVEPVLVHLQQVSDARHADDYALNKALCSNLGVAEEEAASGKMGLGIRFLPPSQEDAATAAHIKRALIKAASIFLGTSISATKQSHLLGKRRKINAATASNLWLGGLSHRRGPGDPFHLASRKGFETFVVLGEKRFKGHLCV